MEQLPDITECIKKANKLQPTQSQVFSLGQEDFYTELNLMKMNNLETSLLL